MLVIEFIGLPGAGKSTVSGKLIRKLQSSGLAVPELHNVKGLRRSGNSPLALSKVIFAALRSSLFYRVMRQIWLKALQDRSKFWRFFVLLKSNLTLQTLRQQQWDVIVLEEGRAQNIVAMSVTGSVLDSSRLIDVVYGAASDHLFVLLDIDISVAIERVRNRETIGRFSRENPELEKLMMRHLSGVASLSAILSNRFPLLSLAATDASDENSDKIVAWATERIASSKKNTLPAIGTTG